MKSKRVRWAGHLAFIVERRCIDSYTWKYENLRQLGRFRCKWEDVKMDSNEIQWEGVELINLAVNGHILSFCECGYECCVL